MKKQILILTLFLGFGTTQLAAQNFIKLLKTGEYAELSEHFSETVKVELDRDKKRVSKERAIKMLQTRMEKFQPVKWETMHKGSSEDKNSGYLIAKVYNANNKGLRVFIHLEEGRSSKRISGIRIRRLL